MPPVGRADVIGESRWPWLGRSRSRVTSEPVEPPLDFLSRSGTAQNDWSKIEVDPNGADGTECRVTSKRLGGRS